MVIPGHTYSRFPKNILIDFDAPANCDEHMDATYGQIHLKLYHGDRVWRDRVWRDRVCGTA
jgi:hypothetical protein